MSTSEADTPSNPELTPRERAALQLMLAKILAKLVADAEKDKRAAAAALFTRPGQAEVAELDGVALGRVLLKAGAESWGTDDDWLAYCEANIPSHVYTQTTRHVSPAFTKAVLAAHKVGDMHERHDTGEVVKLSPSNRLPGITYREGQPTLDVRPDWDVATRAVLAALGDAAQLLGLEPPPAQLEAAEGQEGP